MFCCRLFLSVGYSGGVYIDICPAPDQVASAGVDRPTGFAEEGEPDMVLIDLNMDFIGARGDRNSRAPDCCKMYRFCIIFILVLKKLV